jgi:hypothetical protein
METRPYLSIIWLLSPVILWSQQANVNLDYNPHKNTENLWRKKQAGKEERQRQ